MVKSIKSVLRLKELTKNGDYKCSFAVEIVIITETKKDMKDRLTTWHQV